MSSLGRWTYVNVAQVKPFEGMDMLTGEITYGEEYDILCDYAIKSEQVIANDGAEFVSKHVIFCEDQRPKYLDMIKLPMSETWEEIKAHGGWPMAAFDEPDSPDFRMVT